MMTALMVLGALALLVAALVLVAHKGGADHSALAAAERLANAALADKANTIHTATEVQNAAADIRDVAGAIDFLRSRHPNAK